MVSNQPMLLGEF
jgi:hypothetical protein